MAEIVIFGASGHAKVVIDAIERAQQHHIAAVMDIDVGEDAQFCGYPLRDESSLSDGQFHHGIVAIGDNWTRLKVVSKVAQLIPGFEFVTAIHPSAVIAKSVVMEPGVVVMAGAVINSDTKIGEHVIVNTSASIDHDCVIEAGASINPGATLGGSVVVGQYSAIGLGASVIHGRAVGEHAVIGAGSTVVRDLPDCSLCIGSPAEVVKMREPGPYL